MKPNGPALVGIALCVAALSSPAQSADGPVPVIGTWQLTAFAQESLDTKEVTHPYGDRPTGYIQYAPGGHMVVFITAGDLPRPAMAAHTDAERAAIHKGIIGGYAGTYSVEGNKVIHHVLTSWRPEWIGGDQTRFYESDGKNLTIRTAPIKSTRTGQDIISMLTFVRVE